MTNCFGESILSVQKSLGPGNISSQNCYIHCYRNTATVFTNQQLLTKLTKNHFYEKFLPSSTPGCPELCRIKVRPSQHTPCARTHCVPVKVSGRVRGAVRLEDFGTWKGKPCKVLRALRGGSISCWCLLFLLLRRQFFCEYSINSAFVHVCCYSGTWHMVADRQIHTHSLHSCWIS